MWQNCGDGEDDFYFIEKVYIILQYLYIFIRKPDSIFTIFTLGGYYNMDVNTKLRFAYSLILRWMWQNCGDGEDDFTFFIFLK